MTPNTSGSVLFQALRTWASGASADRAALNLLVEHGHWLDRRDVVTGYVRWVPEEGQTRPAEPLATLDWAGLADALDRGDLAASSSQEAVLRIALSLAGVRPVDLRQALTGLGWASVGPVCGAVATAAQAEHQVLVTVVPPARPAFLDEEEL
ncbi:hypothetical protein ABZ234_31905 [Nocardiopsis sp. NPDC006198]|uniref:hypothetical protein n=1 Tax=Nocardiopsis sp. NPDC006198 TaxID=3154472 RepID=UPI0033A03B12